MNIPQRETREKKRTFPESYDLQTLRFLTRKGLISERNYKNNSIAQHVIKEEKEMRRRERERALILLELETSLTK